MRLRGNLHSIPTTILVDSGSTHNFISEKLATKVNLKPTNAKKISVTVASGDKLVSKGKCVGVRLRLKAFTVITDFYIIPLDGYDIVLGTQWLKTLGEIWWDFSKLIMRFTINNKEITLKGLSTPRNRVIEEHKLQGATCNNTPVYGN